MLDGDEQARLFYLALLGGAILIYVFRAYRHRLGEAAQHAAIWGLIFLGAVLVFGFKDQLSLALSNNAARPTGEDSFALKRADNGHFYVEAMVNGADVLFLVDTGATGVSLAAGDAEAAGIDTGALDYWLKVETANGTAERAAVTLDSIELAGIVDHDVRALVSREGLDQSLLGMDYLSRYRSVRFEGDWLHLTR